MKFSLRFFWLILLSSCVSLSWAQKSTSPIEVVDLETIVNRWVSHYQSAEFAPVNRLLVYPSFTADLSQRNNRAKPTRTERELLAVWKKVLDERFKTVQGALDPRQISLLKKLQQQIDPIYQQLIDHEIIYAVANQNLMSAFATWDDQQQALMVQIRQEQLTRLARQYGVPVSQMNASGDMPDAVSQQIKRLEEQAQQAQQLRLQAEQAEKIKVKDTCRTKKIKLTTLQEERQNWSEVTNSLNDMMRDNYERERALTTQREQAQRRDDEIAELSRYLVKNCSP